MGRVTKTPVELNRELKDMNTKGIIKRHVVNRSKNNADTKDRKIQLKTRPFFDPGRAIQPHKSKKKMTLEEKFIVLGRTNSDFNGSRVVPLEPIENPTLNITSSAFGFPSNISIDKVPKQRVVFKTANLKGFKIPQKRRKNQSMAINGATPIIEDVQ